MDLALAPATGRWEKDLTNIYKVTVVLTMHDGTDFIHWAENQRASTVALSCIAEATAAQSG